MDFEHPITLEQLEQAYSKAVSQATQDANWYNTRRTPWRMVSNSTRGAVFLGIVAGVILPLGTLENGAAKLGTFGFEGSAQLGYAFLVMAGLLYGLDQVFMISQTWVRYAEAEMKIRSLLRDCEWDWLRMKAPIGDPAAAAAKSEEALALFDKLATDSRRVVDEETRTWVTQLREARGALGDLLKRHTAATKKRAEEEEKAGEDRRAERGAPKRNGLRVKIENHGGLQGAIKVSIGTHEEERLRPVGTIVIENVPFGQHRVFLEATATNGDIVELEDLVEVGAGAPAELTLTVS